MLLGGRNKGNDFDPLRARSRALPVRRRLRRIGAPTHRRVRETAMEPVECPTMARGVAAGEPARRGRRRAPVAGCASFDEFTDYEHRGRAFKALVESLASEDRGGCR